MPRTCSAIARWPRRSAVRRRPCGTGCGRRKGTRGRPGLMPEKRNRLTELGPFSPRRSSTADRSRGEVHRRASCRVWGRADLRGGADCPVDAEPSIERPQHRSGRNASSAVAPFRCSGMRGARGHAMRVGSAQDWRRVGSRWNSPFRWTVAHVVGTLRPSTRRSAVPRSRKLRYYGTTSGGGLVNRGTNG